MTYEVWITDQDDDVIEPRVKLGTKDNKSDAIKLAVQSRRPHVEILCIGAGKPCWLSHIVDKNDCWIK